MSDLSTRWLGIPLANPLIVGASRLTADMGVIAKIQEAGAGAIVTASLFEEQIELQNDLLEDFAMDYDSREQPELSVHAGTSYAGPEEHLEWVKRAKRAVSIPLFASLNARTHDVWLDWSERLAETGVDGLELNLYATPCDPFVPGDRIEDEQVALVKEICLRVSPLPVAVKMSPFSANPLNLASRLAKAGAHGVVFFNRFFQPDLDPGTGESVFTFDLSTGMENRLPLRFTALASGRIGADICASTGISSGFDVAKMILAGASAVQVVSVLYRKKLSALGAIRKELHQWMDMAGYATLADAMGRKDALHSTDPYAWKRAQYVRILMGARASIGRYPLL